MANKFSTEQARFYVSERLGMTTQPTQQYRIYDDEVYEKHLVHKFRLSDVGDPEIYIAQPIYEWQQTEHGKWVMTHGRDTQYQLYAEPVTYGYNVIISAHITPKRWTEYVLRGWYTG